MMKHGLYVDVARFLLVLVPVMEYGAAVKHIHRVPHLLAPCVATPIRASHSSSSLSILSIMLMMTITVSNGTCIDRSRNFQAPSSRTHVPHLSTKQARPNPSYGMLLQHWPLLIEKKLSVIMNLSNASRCSNTTKLSDVSERPHQSLWCA